MIDKSQCPICQSPIKSSTDGSLTQWILSCRCYDAYVDQLQTLSARICTSCAKPVKQGLPGSFTQFIFQSEFCSCNAPAEIKAAVLAAVLPTVSEQRQRNEEELAIASHSFPVDRYKPLKMLGVGKFGSVYLARDRLLDKAVAVKTLHALSAKELVSFQQEAKTLSKLKHESIVRILDFGTVNAEVPYMVLDYVEGETLSKVIERDGPMPWERAVEVFGQICEGFEYAHKNGVLHRDLNPQNIVLVDRSIGSNADARQFEVKIIDFGIAGLVNTKIEAGKTPKPEESLVGTPLYMSPDPGNGKPYEIRSEIYSLGCMLFEALSGRPPFIGNSAIETLTMHALEQPPNLSEMSELYIPLTLQRIIEKALAKNPDSRFSTMADFKKALEKARSQAVSGDSDVCPMEPDVSGLGLKETNVRDWTASYPVSLLLGITALAVVGFCFLAYTFATNEQPFGQRLAGAADTQAPDGSARSKRTKKAQGNKAELEPDELEEKSIDEGLAQKWRRDMIRRSWVKGTAESDDDVKFRNLEPGPAIERLKIQSDSLSTKGVKDIADLPALGHLLFRNSTLPKDALSALADSKTLTILDLSYSSPIAADDLKGLTKSPHLMTLKMSHTGIGDEHASALEKSRLVGIMVDHTNLTDASLASFAKIKTLRALTILPAKGITQEGLRRFAKLRSDCNILSDNNSTIYFEDR